MELFESMNGDQRKGKKFCSFMELVHRVCHWDPLRKITRCLSLNNLLRLLTWFSHGLVVRGCRVMLFDLWGRGYSDSCADLEHDDRLYATEILLAVTSSPLSWTGGKNGGFSIIGYSLGGGISATFTGYFPKIVMSLILMAPSGLIRPEHMSFRSRFLYSTGIVPENILRWLVKRRMKAGARPKEKSHIGTGDILRAEVENNSA